MTSPLPLEKGKQLIDSLTRLRQLADSKLGTLDKNAEAEQRGTIEFVRSQLFDHAEHLLGCWWAVQNEYQPLCNAVASMLTRANAIQAQRAAADSTPAK